VSDKSGIASQVISLPQGGGALAGIGESFSPELFTGTGNLTVPLALPPGRNGFAPAFRLTYSTGNGNGPFGLGWDLDLPQVSRKTTKGVPRYQDSATDPGPRDTFVLSGVDDLVPTGESAPGVTRFRPRTEGRFARIEHLRTAEQDVWRVRDRDGSVRLFGTAVAGDEAATVADPAARSRVYAWKLTQTSDTFGNRIQYQYMRDSGQAGGRGWDQLYLERVRYVDYDQDGQNRFLVSVTFVYDERPDGFSSHRAGFEVRTRLRCRRIEVRTHPHPDPDILVRTYELIYADERVRAGDLDRSVLPANGVSLLSQLRVVGHDGERTEQLPPLEFGYTRFQPTGTRFGPLTAAGNQLPARSLADGDLELVDLFGNGLPDLMQMNGEVQFWRNLGGGRFDPPALMPEVPAGVQLRDPGVRLGDFNGDGRADLLVQHLGGYFPLSFRGRWSRQGFVRYERQPSMPLGAPEVRLVDLDGDGVVDALRTGAAFELFFNDPRTGWGQVETRERGPLETFPDLSFADPRVKLADLTGDGLQDIVLVQQGGVDYWPYLGHGRWGPRVSMAHSPVFDDDTAPPALGFEPRRVLLGDVDGDGLDDLVYVQDDRITLWINRGGNGWSDPITLDAPPPVLADVDAVRLADMLGAGTAGVLWTLDQLSPAEATYQFLDCTGGTKPYLLERIDNHRGAVTQVGYAPSTRFYLADQADPATRWATPLPFPVQVVERVEAMDLLSGGKLTSQYRYRHGYWDGAEREFRGFGMVERLDSETFQRYHQPGLHGQQTPFTPVEQVHFSPPTLTKTWFHLGSVGEESGQRHEADLTGEYWPGDPPALGPTATLTGLPASAQADALRALRGSVLRTELYALDGTDRQAQPYTVTESQFGLREEAPPAPGEPARPRVFFPHQLASRTTQWERGEEPLAQFIFTDDYDQYGQPHTHSQIACPRGWRDVATSRSNAYLATATETTYATRDDDTYLVDRVATQTTVEIRQGDDQPQRTMAELRRTIGDGSAPRQVIAQTIHHYDGEPFTGLSAGEVGAFGALVRTERLVLTEEILQQAYGDAIPPYLLPGEPAWTDDYPLEFRQHLPALAGHTRQTGSAAPAPSDGYFAASERRRYDFQQTAGETGRGLVVAVRDALGHVTTVGHDRFELLPTDVTDPIGLTTHADYDHRVLQPSQVIDPNGNRIAYTFSPLGLVQTMAVMGKAGEQLGDTPAVPGTSWLYDFLAFDDPVRRQPVALRTVRRMHHTTDGSIDPADRDQTIETVEFSDGFGRLLQIRSQAEEVTFGDPTLGDAGLPADQTHNADAVGLHLGMPQQPRVVVSGWQVYDNKGRVVEKYEPFFSLGRAYRSPDQEGTESDRDVLGQKATLFYDPLGRLIRMVNPDGSQQRVIHGVPGTITTPELSNPDLFEPTPWESYTYDGNDNAGRTHPASSTGYRTHWNTPSSGVVDALGRTVQTVQCNGTDPTTDWYVIRYSYDLRGNLLTVTDPLGRTAFRHVYDLAANPRVLRVDGIDAGVVRTVLDAAGNVIEQRDSKGALQLHGYDAANRPGRLWARDDAGSPVTLREQLDYGDGGDPDQPTVERSAGQAANLLGRLSRHYDEAGLLTFDGYDFKGDPVATSRQVIADAAILSVFNPRPPGWQVPAFRVDWQPPAATSLEALAGRLLDPTRYQIDRRYDALNRPISITLPQDVGGERKTLRLRYNLAGALEHVELDGTVYVDRIAHNARGQRTLVALGNGVMTRHTYDPVTFRLARLRSERYTKTGPTTYHPSGVPFQDFGYGYDLAGNLLSLHDRTPGGGLPIQPDQLDCTFTYDPIYRLLSASGRECDTPPPNAPWDDTPKCTDITRTRPYNRNYTYDVVGNLLRLAHSAGAGSFTRHFTLDPDNLAPRTNRLSKLTVGASTSHYGYDAAGNLTAENASRHFERDHSNRMRVYRTQPDGAEPSVHAHYLYDSIGERVKKLVRKQGGQVEVTVYIDGVFEHHKRIRPGATTQNNILHVMDNKQRIALIRVGVPFPDDTSPATTYHLGDHLDSSTTVLDAAGGFINREEFIPYGETSFGSYAGKRYRFTGKERDEESGLTYHGARYYAPWLCRWTSTDPAGLVDGPNPYAYVLARPTVLRDPAGTQASDAQQITGTTPGGADPDASPPDSGSIDVGPPGTAPDGGSQDAAARNAGSRRSATADAGTKDTGHPSDASNPAMPPSPVDLSAGSGGSPVTATSRRATAPARQGSGAARKRGNELSPERAREELFGALIAARNPTIQKALLFAWDQLGKPYKYGAKGMACFDCSGLSAGSYRAVGLSIPNGSRAQWNWGLKQKLNISPGQQDVGDLVFFARTKDPDTIHHVGIVLGPEFMIQAPQSGDIVKVSSYHRDDIFGYVRPTGHLAQPSTLFESAGQFAARVGLLFEGLQRWLLR
jgi:RHS repeat-associated protein